jgi:tetratricopeptide (TPR) repeat protein
MMSPPGRVLFIVVVLFCEAITVAKQSSYTDVIELYRRGQDEAALHGLAALTPKEVTAARDALLKAFDISSGEESNRVAGTIRAAVLLHTTRAFVVRSHGDFNEFAIQFKIASTYIDKLASRDRRGAFVRTWRLQVLASLHGQMAVAAAREFGRRERDPAGDPPELLLALGATEEIGWALHRDSDTDPGVNGDLKEAERNYRQALVIMPDLTEARLRLGRVLALRGDGDALKNLEQIGPGSEEPYRCLARLFEGEIFEERGDLAEAERRYLAAVSLVPTAQSAYMALAHVRHARGARGEAAEDIRSTTRAPDVPDTADPWFWYARGTSWRGFKYSDDLRTMIQP